MTAVEKKEIREQIEFYKAYRRTLQFGRFYRFDERKDNKVHWQIAAKEQRVFIKRLGGLVKHVSPMEFHPDGIVLRTVNKVFAMQDGAEDYTLSGAAILAGVKLNSQFTGTGYDPKLHMFGDFGSALYTIEKIK